jgi:long-subunit acyl-CoA synthetase (AMP-forming)
MDLSGQVSRKSSVADILKETFDRHQSKYCLGSRRYNSKNLSWEAKYSFKTYSELSRLIGGISIYFRNKIENKDFYSSYKHKDEKNYNLIGIITKPCEESFILLASLNIVESLVTVPISETLKFQDLRKIISSTNLKTLIIDEDLLNKFLLANGHDIQIGLKNIILINSSTSSHNKYYTILNNLGVNLILLENILESLNNNTNFSQFDNTNPERIMLLTFSKNLKGILISEKSLIETIYNLYCHDSLKIDITSNKSDKLEVEATHPTIYYSLTSLAEITEYCLILLTLVKGGQVGFISGEMRNLFVDLKILQPTMLFCFSSVAVRIYDSIRNILDKLDPGKKHMIEKALKIKKEFFIAHKSLDHSIWDKLIFNKIKKTVGGSLGWILIGGHLENHISSFLKLSLSVNIIEFYGLKESCGVLFLSEQKDLENKDLGLPISNSEFLIKKIKNLNFITDLVEVETLINSGELYIKSQNLFSGFFEYNLNENPSDKNCRLNCGTNFKSFDENGYFPTGDYVLFINNKLSNTQTFKYIDKIENFILTKQGWLVSPIKLEELYNTSHYTNHVSIVDDDHKELVAIVTLNKNNCHHQRLHSESVDSLEQRKESQEGTFRQNSKNLIFRSEKRRSFYKKRDRALSTCEEENIPLEEDKLSYKLCTVNEYNYEDPNMNDILVEEILISFKSIWSKFKLKNYEMIHKIFIFDLNYFKTHLEKSIYKELLFDEIFDTNFNYNRNTLKKIYLKLLKTKINLNDS